MVIPLKFAGAKFHEKFSLKWVFLNPFVTLQCCNKFLQIKNVFQMTIEFLIFAPIPQYNKILGYTPLIAHFHHKIFSKYLKNHIKML